MQSTLEFLSYKTVGTDQEIPNHSHDCHELVYYIKGTGTSIINDRAYHYTQGTFCIISSTVPHSQIHSTITDVIYIGFHTDDMIFLPDNRLYPDDENGSILKHLFLMKQELVDKNPHYQMKLEYILRSLLIDIDRSKNDNASVKAEFSYIKRFIRENCAQKIDKDVLAELSGYSYNRFRFLFKKDTGMSPVNYIIHTRIEKAKRLLILSSATITSIASECGFYDHSQFCSFFKNRTGKTPKTFRKENEVRT